MKSIQLEEDVWEKLMEIKLKGRYKSMSDVVKKLIKDGK